MKQDSLYELHVHPKFFSIIGRVHDFRRNIYGKLTELTLYHVYMSWNTAAPTGGFVRVPLDGNRGLMRTPKKDELIRVIAKMPIQEETWDLGNTTFDIRQIIEYDGEKEAYEDIERLSMAYMGSDGRNDF